MDLTQFDGYTPGPWSSYTEPQPNGCPIVGAHGLMVAMLAHTVNQPEQREEAMANACLIAAAPDLLAEVRRLTAEAADLRRERDELARRSAELSARLAEIERAEPMDSAQLLPCPFCGDAPRTLVRANNCDETEFFAAVACYCGGYAACAHKDAIAPTPSEAAEMSRAAWNTRQASAAAPERAEPDHCEDARGMVCATRGALLGGRAVCGDIHPGSNTCCSTDRCAHQRPRPCRCGPDSVARPKGGAA